MVFICALFLCYADFIPNSVGVETDTAFWSDISTANIFIIAMSTSEQALVTFPIFR